jgi:RNA polymerase sigma-70 factor, ECF subfamily
MLGSRSETEDAVQESWLRLASADAGGVDNLRGWLTTTVARICLDMLRRRSRRDVPIDEKVEAIAAANDTGQDAEIADAIGVAMLVVLETLAPAERVAFVLHDVFNLPFEEIAPIVNRSPAAARQLASRARRRVQVGAFLAAARGNDFGALLAVLDPGVVLHADATAIAASRAGGAAAVPLVPEIRGADAVARIFAGRAQAARPAEIDGEAGLVFAPGGKPFALFDFVIDNGRIVEINLIADTQRMAALVRRCKGQAARARRSPQDRQNTAKPAGSRRRGRRCGTLRDRSPRVCAGYRRRLKVFG